MRESLSDRRSDAEFIKPPVVAWHSMDALTILFALTIIGGGGALGWRMWALEQRMNLTQQNTEEKLDEQRQTSRSSLVALHHTLASLEAGTQALLSTQPQLEGRIALHSAIAKSESILDRSITSSAELKEGGKSLISAVRDLIGTIGGDGKLEQVPEGDVGLSTLSRRLFIVLEKCGLGPVDRLSVVISAPIPQDNMYLLGISDLHTHKI